MPDRTGVAYVIGIARLLGGAVLAVHVAFLSYYCSAAAAADKLVMGLPVPSVTVFAGDVLDRSLLTTKRFRLRSTMASSYVRSIDSAVGLAARRTLVAGRPIPVNAISAPFLVKEGRRVRIVFRSKGLEISAAGLALQSGGEGDIVGARNVDSGRTVKGTVARDGSIVVGGQP